jgi:UDPglucose 6-dehydrogenase
VDIAVIGAGYVGAVTAVCLADGGHDVTLVEVAEPRLHADDTRYSPAISVARELLARGARVVAHDPAVPETVSAQVTGLERARSVEGAVAEADLVILATEWRVYRALDWASLGNVARSRVIFDGRNALDVPALQQAGWWVLRIGTTMRAPGSSGRSDPARTAAID